VKKIRHSKLPIWLLSKDNLTYGMLRAIEIQMTEYGWDDWIDENNNWFTPYTPNPNQLELFDGL
tara:strand:+ start:214 stop:405 length:192 start_codon:yes stop_codon:yes gene_type:complete